MIVHDPRSGQFTFQNGTGCMVRCVSTDGQIVPFQFTQIGLLSKLANVSKLDCQGRTIAHTMPYLVPREKFSQKLSWET